MANMTVSHQPKYSESIHKFMARELNIRLYRLITGNKRIPDNKQYLTLANIQDKSPSSEINQMVIADLLSPYQFVGIDNSKTYIKANKKNHPNALWHDGDWNVLLSTRQFDPALVYLDSTHFGDKLPALKTLKNTLDACVQDTLVICNVMETNPRSGLGEFLDTTVLLEGLLYKEIPAKYKDWNKSKETKSWKEIENSDIVIPSYGYQTAKTLMKSYIFYKGFLPPEHKLDKLFADFEIWCDDFEETSL